MTVDVSLIPQERIKDLISTLDNIQNNLSNNLVHKSGDETITGIKTFSSVIKRSSTIDQSTTSGEVEVSSIAVCDKDGSSIGMYNTTRSTTTNTNRQRVVNKNVTGSNWFDFRVNVNDAGKGWVNTAQGTGITSNGSLSDVSSSTTDTTIPTKGWVNNPSTSTNVVHRSGDETIAGTKTFSSDLNISGSKLIVGSSSNDSHYLEVRGKTSDTTSKAYIMLHIPGVKYSIIKVQGDTQGIQIRKGDDSDYDSLYCKTESTSDNSTKVATTNWSKIVHPTYPNITTSTRSSVPADTDYSIPYDCWVWWGNTSYVGIRYLYVNGIEFGHSYGNSGHWEEFNTLFFPIKAGNVIRHTGSNSTCYLYQNVY